MSPQEFKAEIQRKGWTYRALATRWGVRESYISRLSRNSERSGHWDDAVRGLPMILVVEPKSKKKRSETNETKAV